MLKFTKVKFSIRYNELARMNIESSMMHQDLRITWKLSIIFTLNSLKSPAT